MSTAVAVEEIVWNGQTFRRFPEHENRSRRVYFMATTAPREYLHRALYKHHHGPIPEGWHVHHVDHNPLNNTPSNLAAVSPSEHAEHHGHQHPTVRAVCAGCGVGFDGQRPWAKWCSPACKERSRRAAGLTKPRPRKGPFSELRACEECGTHYEAKRPWARFCTSRCKQRTMRRTA